VLNGPPPDKFDAHGKGFLGFVSINKREGGHVKSETGREGWQLVGASYLVPRAYVILQGIGWWNICEKDVFAE
jgi:hypothetical protein